MSNTILNAIIGSAILLPGFFIERIRSSTREYVVKDNFSSTIQSFFFSLILFILWFLSNCLFMLFDSSYLFTTYINRFQNYNIYHLISNKKIIYPILLYIFVFISFGFIVHAWEWLYLSFKLRKFLGLHRFTRNLTPWEDFIFMSSGHWVDVELSSGCHYIGMITISSHNPFEKEIVISSSDYNPMIIYNKEFQKINYEILPDQVYLNLKNIVSISRFPKKNEMPSKLETKNIILNLFYKIVFSKKFLFIVLFLFIIVMYLLFYLFLSLINNFS